MGKSFIERLRDPDEDFLSHLRMLARIIPLGLGFFIVIVLLIIMVITKNSGTGTLVTQDHLRLSGLLSFLIIFIPYAILKILQGYVWNKLKKDLPPRGNDSLNR
jgi:hypothetical protein